jgi:hypothetical protein
MGLRLLVPALLLFTSVAHAAPVVFTDKVSFEAATGDLSLTTFDAPLNTLFNSPLGRFEVYFPDVTVYYDLPEIGVAGKVAEFSHLVQFIFPTPVLAFGFDVTILTAVNPVITWHAGTTSLSHDLATGFIGVTFEQPILNIDLFPFRPASEGGSPAPFEVDNLLVEQVPEPAVLTLVGLAIGVAVRASRRGRRDA